MTKKHNIWTAQDSRVAKKVKCDRTNTDLPSRKSKRHTAKDTPTPRNFDEMLKQAESLARESIYAETCARMIKHKGPPFRLLDLPPDIRMRIFDYMVSRPYSLQLHNLVAPLITAVSKQVRAECMAGFFALNTFQMIVEANICLNEHITAFCDYLGSLHAARQHPHLTNDGRYLIDLIYRLEPMAGGIRMLASSERWLQKIHPKVAVFRNVEVLLKDAYNHPTACASNRMAPRAIQSAWILKRLYRWGRNEFTVSLWHSAQLVPHFVGFPMDPSTVIDHYDTPLEKVWGLITREDPMFRTFNLEALKSLAYVIEQDMVTIDQRPSV